MSSLNLDAARPKDGLVIYYGLDRTGLLVWLSDLIKERELQIVECVGKQLLGRANIMMHVRGPLVDLEAVRDEMQRLRDEHEIPGLSMEIADATDLAVEGSLQAVPWLVIVEAPDHAGVQKEVCEILFAEGIGIIAYEGLRHTPKLATDEVCTLTFTVRVPVGFSREALRRQLEAEASERGWSYTDVTRRR